MDLQNYKEYNENYYSTGHYENIRHNLKIHDVVKINDNLSYNKGYEGHIGIIESLSGLNEYVYVMAYNSDSKRYWVCGFGEGDLTKMQTKLEDINSQLNLNEGRISTMKKVTVDVIYSMECGDLPIILEVIDTEDIQYTMNRQKYWSEYYKNVHVTSGIDFNKHK